VLGLPYATPATDMWQAGCLVYALCTGQDLFAPSASEALQLGLDDSHLAEMTSVLGRMPRDMIEASPLKDRCAGRGGQQPAPWCWGHGQLLTALPLAAWTWASPQGWA
jgi:hypothetical protein